MLAEDMKLSEEFTKQTREMELKFDELCKKIINLATKKELLKICERYHLSVIALQRVENHGIDKRDLFLLIKHHISWFNYDILHYIVANTTHEDADDCRRRLAEYDRELKGYFETRSIKSEKETRPQIGIGYSLIQNLREKLSVIEAIEKKKFCDFLCDEEELFTATQVNNAKVSLLALNVDRAWDKHVLEGENCQKTCHKIASILGKGGCVLGQYIEPWLYIIIAQ